MESNDKSPAAQQDVTQNPDGSGSPDYDHLTDKTPTRTPQEAGWNPPVPFTYESYITKVFTDWAGMAPRYEWTEEEKGEIGPRNEELEKELFNAELVPSAGQRFNE